MKNRIVGSLPRMRKKELGRNGGPKGIRTPNLLIRSAITFGGLLLILPNIDNLIGRGNSRLVLASWKDFLYLIQPTNGARE